MTALLAWACTGPTTEFDRSDSGDFFFGDEDGDGWDSNHDCDDHSETTYPGAEELCNGVDDDCDDELDEGHERVDWCVDEDLDGYGDPETCEQACASPQDGQDWVDNGDDCDDTTPAVWEDCD